MLVFPDHLITQWSGHAQTILSFHHSQVPTTVVSTHAHPRRLALVQLVQYGGDHHRQ